MARNMKKEVFLKRLQEGAEAKIHAKAKKKMMAQGRFYTLDVNKTVNFDDEHRAESEAQFEK